MPDKSNTNKESFINKVNKFLSFLIIAIGIIVLSSLLILILNRNKGPQVKNTTWISESGSELVLTNDRLDWYKTENVYSDNYYSGTYSFYIGKKAVKYLTEDLSEFGVTESELQSLFKNNSQYDESNFVVFDIRYDKFIMDNEEKEMWDTFLPWYGFLLKDGTYLEVVNIKTNGNYKFTKKEK